MRNISLSRALLALFVTFALVGCDQKKPADSGEASPNRTGVDQVSQATPTAQTKPTHNLVVRGAFEPGVGDPSGLPDDAPQRGLAKVEITDELASALNDQKSVIIDQVLARHDVVPTADKNAELPTMVVEFGSAVEPDPKRPMTHAGLLVRVDIQRPKGHRAASRQIPPADNAGELMANLDHTLDALVTIALEEPESPLQ